VRSRWLQRRDLVDSARFNEWGWIDHITLAGRNYAI
jgi:hypothetical protein